MREVIDSGEVVLSRFDDALAAVPSGGLAYLPTVSYREMEGWSLPTPAALRFLALEEELGDERLHIDGALVRGAHWRNFLVKYPESNRMHKKMLALSNALSRARRPGRRATRHRSGAVQRRLLARRLRRAVPAVPARRDLAEPGRSRAGAARR